MDSGERYHPTEGDILSVLRLLHDNGVSVENSKKAYEELRQYQANPSFCILLSHVFVAESCPLQTLSLDGSWIQYRRLAGITLKNNLEKSEYALGLVAVREAARCALSVLGNPSDTRIARVAAQIVVRITSLTSFDWWREYGLGDLPNLLLNELFNAGDLKTFSALYTLQYLMEDLPKDVGAASENIIVRVAALVMDQNAQIETRKAGFRMCFNMYEQAQYLDWNVDGLSPLQTGLTNASSAFASVCTSLLEEGCGGDTTMIVQVLRSCGLLLDYFEYFLPISDAEMTRLLDCWIGRTLTIVTSGNIAGEFDIQIKTAAMDLLTLVMELYDRMGGEGYVSLLVGPMLRALSTFVPALVGFVPMTKDDVENILSQDDFTVRDVGAVDFHFMERNKDISEDTFLDDERAAASLRSSALRCIDALCVLSSKESFPHLFDRVKALWNAEWPHKETAIVLVGTIANGCYTEIQPMLPTVARQLISTVVSPSEDIFVVSMAIWSLSRILEWAYTYENAILTDILEAFTARMQSTSKRVQQAAVSALNSAFVTGHSMGATSKIIGSLPHISEMVASCLPMYYDGNLCILCDLALHLITLAEHVDVASHVDSAFKANRIERAKSFEISYMAVYINEAPNTQVDKDIFSIDRVIAGLLTRFPDPRVSLGFLDTWHATLKDAVNRDVWEDAGLLCSIVCTCQNFVNVTQSAALIEWSRQTQGSLASLGFQLLVTSHQNTLRSATVTLLHRLLKTIGSSAIPAEIGDRLLVTLTTAIREVDDPYEKLELVRLIMAMVEAYSSELTQNAYAAFCAAVDTLRSDAYNDSLRLFAQMVHEVCSALSSVPLLVGQSRPDVLTAIMSQTENTYEKSVATIRLVDALLSSEEVALAVFPDVMRLVYSWQQSACDFPGTREKLKSLLFFYNSKQCEQLRDHLNALHPNIRAMLMSTYDIS